jgi:hypothetical protein
MNQHHDDDRPDIPSVIDYVSNDVPIADSFQVMRCSDPSHAHIVLLDVDDNPIAQFTVLPHHVETIVIACNGIFSLPRRQ